MFDRKLKTLADTLKDIASKQQCLLQASRIVNNEALPDLLTAESDRLKYLALGACRDFLEAHSPKS